MANAYPHSRKRNPDAAFREHLLPHELRRLEAIEARMDELTAEFRKLQAERLTLNNRGNSRRLIQKSPKEVS